MVGNGSEASENPFLLHVSGFLPRPLPSPEEDPSIPSSGLWLLGLMCIVEITWTFYA